MNAIVKYMLRMKQHRQKRKRLLDEKRFEERGVIYPGWQSTGYHRPVYPEGWEGPKING